MTHTTPINPPPYITTVSPDPRGRVNVRKWLRTDPNGEIVDYRVHVYADGGLLLTPVNA